MIYMVVKEASHTTLVSYLISSGRCGGWGTASGGGITPVNFRLLGSWAVGDACNLVLPVRWGPQGSSRAA